SSAAERWREWQPARYHPAHISQQLLRLPRMHAGRSRLLPVSHFRFRDHRFTAWGRPRQPVRRPSLCYGGTGALTTPARPDRPATGVDRAHGVPTSRLATVATHLVAIIFPAAAEARRAGLTGGSRVDSLQRTACALCLVAMKRARWRKGQVANRRVILRTSGAVGPLASPLVRVVRWWIPASCSRRITPTWQRAHKRAAIVAWERAGPLRRSSPRSCSPHVLECLAMEC